MADTYEPYEPPAAPAREPQDGAGGSDGAAPQQEWPLLAESDPAASSPPTPPPVYVQNPYRQPPRPPRKAAHPGAVIVAMIAVAAVGIGSYSASQPDEPDYRQDWEECLDERAGDGGLLEPEEICSITFPEGEDDYGDLGYDNPEDEYDWYLEDEYP